MSTAVERKYALTKIAPGDYLLPSNDARTIWRIAKYTEGPSSGLKDWARDRDVWGVWRWTEPSRGHVDTDDWYRWEMEEACCLTRAEAVEAALKSR
jgi:hypothetical protein